MDNIIQHFIKEGIKNLQDKILKLLKEGEGLTAIVAEIKKETDALGRGICVEIIESLDSSIKQDPKRKKDWYVERTNDEKSVITKLGQITYHRTYYKSKDGKKCRHLVDEILGISPHERIDREVRAELVEGACNLSYRKTGANTCDVEISGQTVMKSVRSIEKLKLEKLAGERKTVDFLYVEADEDHIALQTGGTAMPRLVYVHEGITEENGRRRLLNPYYIAGLKGKSAEIWQEVYEYIEDNYETDKIKTIYLSGDGAAWIKQGLDFLPNSKFVLDRYHMNKYVTKATAHMPGYATKIWDCLNEVDLEEMSAVFIELYGATESESKKKEIEDSWNYFTNNWAGIEIREKENMRIIGCSAEGHNSHVLAARMSSRPMGWSIDGAEKMARLRAFKANKGVVLDFIKTQDKEEKLYNITKKLLKQTAKGLKSKTAERLNNIAIINIGKKTGLYNELKSIR